VIEAMLSQGQTPMEQTVRFFQRQGFPQGLVMSAQFYRSVFSCPFIYLRRDVDGFKDWALGGWG